MVPQKRVHSLKPRLALAKCRYDADGESGTKKDIDMRARKNLAQEIGTCIINVQGTVIVKRNDYLPRTAFTLLLHARPPCQLLFQLYSTLNAPSPSLASPARQEDYWLVGGVPRRPSKLALHPRRNFRRHRHVVEALRDGRARAPVYALGHSLPRMHVHPKREAAPQLDGKLRLGKPLPRLWLGTRADGFQTTPLRRIVQIYVAQKASSV